MRNRLINMFLFFCLSVSALAAPPAVYVKQTDLALDAAYKRVYEALEQNKFWVVFEADLLARMSRFKDKWGEEFNRADLSGAKSMVFCNIWWTNQIASADPDMLALCPLHISLYEKDGKTSIVMLRPSTIAKGSSAEAQAGELENELTAVIEKALSTPP